MSEHDLYLPPSSADRNLVCTAAAQACIDDGIVEKTSVYAAEGTCVHELLELMHLANSRNGADHLRGTKKTVDGYEFTITDEMIEYAMEAYDYCTTGFIERIYGDNEIVVNPGTPECKIPLFYNPKQNCTIDYFCDVFYGKSNKWCDLHIFDYKNGKGVEVFVEKNNQFMIYAASWLFECPITRCLIRYVYDHLMQPPLKKFEFEKIDPAYLTGEYAEFIKEKYKTITSNDWSKLEFVPSEKTCIKGFCPKRFDCPARLERANKYLTVFDKAKEINGHNLTDEQYIEILEYHKELTGLINDCIEEAHKRALNGTKFRGWKLVESTKRRVWKDPVEAEKICKRYFKHDQMYETKLRSAPQMAKLAKDLTKIKSKTLEDQIGLTDGKLILVRDGDKRPEYNPLQLFENTPEKP